MKRGGDRHVVLAAWVAALCIGLAAGLMAPDAPAAAAAAQCGPSLLGAPCAQDGVATQAEAGAATNIGIGNPVNLATGNKYQRELDLPALPGVLGVELLRHYNARDLRADPLGRNWVWSYDTRAFRVGDSVQIVQADGSRVDFTRGAPGGATCLPADPALGVLHVRAGVRGETLAWQWRDGRVLSFDEDGFLVGISVASGQALSIRRARDAGRHRGAMLEVVDPDGRRLVFEYGAAAADGWRPLQRVLTPSGPFTYAQDAERRLSTVTSRAGDARDYLYEAGASAWLTGIVLRPAGGAPQRVRSWAYDARGRVMSAVRGPPDAHGGLQIEYADGQTRVRDAAGGVTRLTHRQAGARTVLTAVEGKGCEDCARVDGSRHYDALGRLTQAEGIGVERDVLARVVALREAGATTRVAWLADSALPTQVDAPSAVAGRNHVRRIDWLQFSDPATGLWRAVPKRIAETGWRPGAAGPQAISRGWLLDWRIERGVATLVGARREDARGDEEAVARAALMHAESAAAMRPASAAKATSKARVGTAPVFPSSPEGNARLSDPLAIPGWPGLAWQRDDFGFPVRAAGSGGRAVAGAETRDYDPAGRLVARVFADGTRWFYDYDERGQLQRHLASRAGETVETRLAWQDGLPIRIAHPVESEQRSYGPDGRLRRREVARAADLNGAGGNGGQGAGAQVDGESGKGAQSDGAPRIGAPGDGSPVHYAESFAWDTQGRMQQHDLPEGGSVFYDWSATGLAAIRYAAQGAPEVRIFSQTVAQSGATRRWFNGVQGRSLPGQELLYEGRQGVLLTLARRVDRQGRVLVEGLGRPLPAWARDVPPPRAPEPPSLSTVQLPATSLGAVAVLLDNVSKPLRRATASIRPAIAAPSGVFALSRYAYDDAGRVIVASHAGGAGRVPALWPRQAADFYAWRTGGEAAAHASHGWTRTPTRVREPGGLPRRADGFDLRHGPSRRLAAVDRAGVPVARYAHNAFGERVLRQVGADAPTHDFYLGQQLVAEQGSGPPGTIARRYLYAGPELVAIIEYPGGRALQAPSSQQTEASWADRFTSRIDTLRAHAGMGWMYALLGGKSSSAAPRVLAVHPDASGTPRLVTDADQVERWRGDFGPFGDLRSEAGDVAMRMRLPGQVFDAETGWHDNYLRTYDPHAGSYLEPDPLGAEPGTEAFGYAAQQPGRFIDPLGLLLFAFDGTRNAPSSRTNIFLMSQWYQDTDISGDASAALLGSEAVHYISGPGSQTDIFAGMVDTTAGTTVEARIATQWERLIQELAVRGKDKLDPLQIDIIGFSRGAAAARDFANRIANLTVNGRLSLRSPTGSVVSACINLRFLGLFDTVAQMGIDGKDDAAFDFTIAPGWDQVAQIVALSERRYLFPSTLTQTQEGNAAELASSIAEIGLIGAHSDIGGGYTYEQNGAVHGDLSDVALAWMLNQARGAGLTFSNVPTAYRKVTDPVVHQEMNARPFFREVDGDRRVFFADGGVAYTRQDYHPSLGKNLRDELEAFIVRDTPWSTQTGPAVGYVRMFEYQQWLARNVGVQMLQ
jgi:RHS repeat-associated protein